MNAKELMFGNLLEYSINDSFSDRVPYYGKSIYSVAVIMDDSVKLDIGFNSTQRVLFNDQKLKPIPLTAEWLVKFGFVNKKSTFQRGYHNPKFSGLIIISYIENVSQWSLSIGEYKNITEFEYVHEFQNIIHALTGSELEINY